MSRTEFGRLLDDGDVDGLCAAWAQVAPHLPQPTTRAQAEIIMHRARTEAASVMFAKRAWSHRWLTERGLPSGLPDTLKPRAERMYPRVVDAVGIACKTRSAALAPAAVLIRGAMETAVQHCYADGRTEPGFVRAQMMQARQAETQRLFGAIAVPTTPARPARG